MISSSLPSTPLRHTKRHLQHETVSPYFSRVLTTSPASSSRSDDSPTSTKKPGSLKRHKSILDTNPSTSNCFLGKSCFIDDETYVAHGVSVQLLKDPLYAFHLRKFTRLYSALWEAKPILIQERVSDDPWKLLVASMLLNKTAGKQAIPVFWGIMDRWPSPEALSHADALDVKLLIQPLGLQETRSKRMIELSKAYIADRPREDVLHPTKAYLVPASGSLAGDLGVIVKEKYPPTPISHLPGCGPYAFDSYRIFCMPGDEWKSVMPADKELIKYMKWRWALFEQRRWDPVYGVVGPADSKYLGDLPKQVALTN